ncbi:MAG: TROVE domain-containing protein [Sporocytophaga sp.]|uniref:TROVE domain-containing protein n=1 Tax=Sporocytophaga sp. TaxID=2231183 RepID=UPI001AFFFDC3|nr:TROVE domain-containing protein [Sporocytophaga sp.]MBO9702372.1 TROVE domain-containing protein [Sporocytophaga sp.]
MRFNFLKGKNVVRNYEGAKAYELTPEMELYSAVVTAGLSDSFYESGHERLKRIQSLMIENDAAFVAKLAVYARTSMHMRSVPLVLAIELAKYYSGTDLVSKTVKGVVQRADEITELLAYYQLANGRTGTKKLNKLSKQVQKGLSQAFNSFDEYQFAKYDRDGEVKLRDALFLIHPKAKDGEQQNIFNKIASQSLEVPYTWETELSALGQTKFSDEKEKASAFKAKWEELIESEKLGYMALLRNLRNIIQADVDYTCMQKVCSRLSNAHAVAKSKQFPFRFLAAYREVKELKSDYVTMVLSALEDAVVASAQNIKGFDETTKVVVACDVSGSMQKPVSAKSKVLFYDIGLMLAMLMQSKSKRVISGMFGDKWKIINMPNNGVLANVGEFYRREGEVGYSTNGHLVIDDLYLRKIVMDKIMIFTDCQLWNSTGGSCSIADSWKDYKKIAPQAKLYLFDLAGYGNSPLRIEENDVFLIAGWSDKVFDVLEAIENGESAISKIKEVEL